VGPPQPTVKVADSTDMRALLTTDFGRNCRSVRGLATRLQDMDYRVLDVG